MKNEMSDFWELSSIPICIDGKEGWVSVIDYVEAKTKDLQDFGYKSLSKKSVLESTWRAHSNQLIGENVIDQFVKHDVPVGDKYIL